MQRALLYFGFDYAVQRCDRVGYFLLASGSPSSLISIRAAMFSLRLESTESVLSFMSQSVRVNRDDFVYPATHTLAEVAKVHWRGKKL